MKECIIFIILLLHVFCCFGQNIEPIPQGAILANEGKYEEAIKAYSFSIKLEPTNAEYYFRRGKLYLKVCNYDAALLDFNKTSELKPDYCQAYIYSAYVDASQQKSIDALQKYDAMCKNNCPQEDIDEFKALVFPVLQESNYQKEIDFCMTIFKLFLKKW
jgi:tetratricopeptide (TPR) repeat protein